MRIALSGGKLKRKTNAKNLLYKCRSFKALMHHAGVAFMRDMPEKARQLEDQVIEALIREMDNGRRSPDL